MSAVPMCLGHAAAPQSEGTGGQQGTESMPSRTPAAGEQNIAASKEMAEGVLKSLATAAFP